MKPGLVLLLAAFFTGAAAFAGSAGAETAAQTEVIITSQAQPAATAGAESPKAGAGSTAVSEKKAVEIIRAAFPDLNWEDGQPDISLDNDYYSGGMVWRINFYGRNRYRPGPSPGFHASVDASTGDIVDFYLRDASETGGERIISRDEAKTIAENFARRLQPEKFRQTQLQTKPYPRIITPQEHLNISYHFFWSRTANGLKINDNGIGVTIDALSGKVTSYNFHWQRDLQLPETAAVIPVEELSEKLIKETGMALIYHVPYENYTGGTPRARLVYQANSRYPLILDAVTGESLDYRGRSIDLKEARQFEDIPAAGGEMNPPAPGKERISATEAMEKAQKFFRALGYEGEVERRGGGSGSGPLGREEYWSYGLKSKEGKNQQYDYLSVGIEVFSGRVANFHGRDQYGSAPPTEGKALTREEAVKIAREFIMKVEPDLAGHLALEKAAPWYIVEGPPLHYIRFSRVVNGIPFPQDGINMTVGYNGKIVDYGCQWHRVAFPPAKAEVSAGDAARTWLENSPLKLKYFFPRDENGKPQQPRLAYQAEYNGAQYVDALSGEALTEGGRVPKQAAGGKYDFSSSWAARQLELIADSGLLPPPEEFSPTAPVTRRDGIRLLAAATGNPYGYGEDHWPSPYFADIKSDDQDYRIIQSAADMGVYEKGGNFRPEDNLTRLTLAAWLVNRMGYKNVAAITNKIESPFKDIAGLSRQDQNYIGLANGLGFMAGDGAGNFNPEAGVTWEELSAAVLKAAPKLRDRAVW